MWVEEGGREVMEAVCSGGETRPLWIRLLTDHPEELKEEEEEDYYYY